MHFFESSSAFLTHSSSSFRRRLFSSSRALTFFHISVALDKDNTGMTTVDPTSILTGELVEASRAASAGVEVSYTVPDVC